MFRELVVAFMLSCSVLCHGMDPLQGEEVHLENVKPIKVAGIITGHTAYFNGDSKQFSATSPAASDIEASKKAAHAWLYSKLQALAFHPK